MKHLKSFESKNTQPKWCLPNSKIRHEITNYIEDILVDIKKDTFSDFADGGKYVSHISGWIDGKPYVWISGAEKRSGFSRVNVDLNEVKDTIDTIKSYLESNGFNVEVKYLETQVRPPRIPEKNIKEIYIYFYII
jgi:hypothetical protein